jgi:uncharacterized Tic20 family protein
VSDVPPPPPPPPSPPAPSGDHPSGLPNEVRNWGMGAHLSAFLGAWVALAFVGPLVLWLVKREQHPFIEFHGREALNFNLSMTIYLIVAGLASIVLIGLPFLVAIGVAWLILPIVAAVKASNGESYRYPLTIRFLN